MWNKGVLILAMTQWTFGQFSLDIIGCIGQFMLSCLLNPKGTLHQELSVAFIMNLFLKENTVKYNSDRVDAVYFILNES